MDELKGLLEKKHSVHTLEPVASDVILEAEKKLGMTFPSEYREYLSKYGCLSFSSHEMTGLGVDGYLNVVQATLDERGRDSSFPSDCFIVKNLCIDGVLILQNTNGEILEYRKNTSKVIFPSLKDYLLSL